MGKRARPVSSDGVTVIPELGWAARTLCRTLGHSYPARVVRAADVLRDDGEDHTYRGCVRCGMDVDA